MSDNLEELKTSYRKHVKRDACIILNKGLFPIPELPEMRGPNSKGLVVWWLAWLWGKDGFIAKLLQKFTLTVKALIYPIDKHRESTVKWLQKTTTVELESLDQIWRCGWIVCAAIDGSLPGVCAGHSANETTLDHAQSLAEHYLGVEPVFTKEEMEDTVYLNKRLEWKLVHYLKRIKEAIDNLVPAVSKPNTPRTMQETQAYTLDYVARGVGLHAAQTNKKASFKIYPTAQQSLEPGEITIIIRGPNDVSSAVVPPIYGKTQILRQNYNGHNSNSKFTEPALPLTQGTSYYRNYGKNDMKKMFYIPKVKQDVDIDINVRRDHAKVTYKTREDGNYDISLISRGCDLVGSPFKIVSSIDNIDIEHCPDLEDDDECGIVDVKNDRKVVLRIVDFVTEKMLLKDNGQLEKISDDEAEELITKAVEGNADIVVPYQDDLDIKLFKSRKNIFKTAVQKVVILNKVCKHWKNISMQKSDDIKSNYISRKSFIPDIVNSTFYYEDTESEGSLDKITITHTSFTNKNPFIDDDIDAPVVQAINLSSNNPFINIMAEENKIKIIVEDVDTENKIEKDDVSLICSMPRPKTPILKIINEEITDRPDSVYFTEDDRAKSNEFFNPIYNVQDSIDFLESTNKTDFIIGAPVNVIPKVSSSTPETEMDSIILAPNLEEALNKYEEKIKQIKNADINKDSEEISKITAKYEQQNTQIKTDKKVPYKKRSSDLRDSAYVSIDDSNSTPDSISESPKIEELNIDYHERHFKMGPAEMELWRSCRELVENSPLPDSKSSTITSSRMFTPIREEIDSSLTQNSFLANAPTSTNQAEPNSLKTYQNCEKLQAKECSLHIDYTTSTKKDFTASAMNADAKRGQGIEGELTSEIQSCSEFGSASWSLQEDDSQAKVASNIKSFSEKPNDNIVLEKKKYWDERIKYLEEISIKQEKQKAQLISRKSSESPSKTRNKNTVTTLIMSPDTSLDHSCNVNHECVSPTMSTEKEEPKAEPQLVSKWRKYWDEKLQQNVENKDLNTKTLISKNEINLQKQKAIIKILEECKESSKKINTSSVVNKSDRINSESHETSLNTMKPYNNDKAKLPTVPLKVTKTKSVDDSTVTLTDHLNTIKADRNDEVKDVAFKRLSSHSHNEPENRKDVLKVIDIKKDNNFDNEEDGVLKAFETNPRRFFGKSRKNIFEKMDTYLGPTVIEIKDFYDLNGSSDESSHIVSKTAEKFLSGSKEESNDIIDRENAKRVLIDMIEKRKTMFNKTESSLSNKIKQIDKISTRKNKKLTTSKSENNLYSQRQNDESLMHMNEELPKVNIKKVISIFECSDHKVAKEKKNTPHIHKQKNFSSIKDVSENNVNREQTHGSNDSSHDSGMEDTRSEENNDDYEIKVEPRQRFKMAKIYFQSLNSLPRDKQRKPNECESLLDRSCLKRGSYSFSAPTSDIENDLCSISSDNCEEQRVGPGGRKLMKISEKFQVDDLFNDVVGEGKLSRQGSFRGIPNKHAVLAAFKSMDNCSNKNASYEMALKQLRAFASENKIKNVQTYQSEYPYLPKTNPNQYRSRIDAKATGLISRKELLKAKVKPRRNSVPDLRRLNENFSVTI